MYEGYKNRMSRNGVYMGQIMRNESNRVTTDIWMNSVSTYPVVVHSVASGLPTVYTSVSDYTNPLYAHFETKKAYNVGSNEPEYYLTFAPYVIGSNLDIKIGSYVNIPLNDTCEYWLIVHIDDDNELKKCQIIKCDKIFKWISNGKIYQCLGCQRYSNSYNSGSSKSGNITEVDNTISAWMPTNLDSENLTYDQRLIISDGNRIPPLVWKVSKILNTLPIGLTKFNLDQDAFNPSTDNVELMLADYDADAINVLEYNEASQGFEIAYNGTKSSVRVGSYKVFTANLPEDNHFDIMWSVIDGDIVYGTNSYDNTTQIFGDYTLTTTDRTLRLKVAQNYNLVGKVLTVRAVTANGDVGEFMTEVVS